VLEHRLNLLRNCLLVRPARQARHFRTEHQPTSLRNLDLCRTHMHTLRHGPTRTLSPCLPARPPVAMAQDRSWSGCPWDEALAEGVLQAPMQAAVPGSEDADGTRSDGSVAGALVAREPLALSCAR
jgi:hypothetical protein